MPNFKAHLKNTKVRKVKFVYSNKWEQDFQNLRKFLSSARSRLIDYSKMCELTMVEPGAWNFSAKVGRVSPSLNIRCASYVGRGRNPEEAFKQWWIYNVDNLTDGWVLFLDESYSGTPLKAFGFSERTGKLEWLPYITLKRD